MTASAPVQLNNLPAWCVLRGLNAEAVRRFMRKRPDLRQLGQVHGPMRLLSEAEFGQVATAFAARTDGRKAKAKKG